MGVTLITARALNNYIAFTHSLAGKYVLKDVYSQRCSWFGDNIIIKKTTCLTSSKIGYIIIHRMWAFVYK